MVHFKLKSFHAGLVAAASLSLACGSIVSFKGAAGAVDDDARGTPVHSLYAQSAARILDGNFPSRDISFLLMDARTGALIASRWPDAERPIALGSLVKPFAALAYAEQHEYQYPIFVCRGAASGCWQPRPHGRLDVSQALAYSCNSYFRELTSHLTGSQMQDVALQFGIDAPDSRLTGPPLMGLGSEWKVSPMHMAHGYLELVRRRSEPAISEILGGLAESARWGTGRAAGRVLKGSNLLVKTGTAVCHHTPRAPGDGFVVAITPADQPELLLMVRVHGVPGSRAAVTAGRMLSRLQN